MEERGLKVPLLIELHRPLGLSGRVLSFRPFRWPARRMHILPGSMRRGRERKEKSIEAHREHASLAPSLPPLLSLSPLVSLSPPPPQIIQCTQEPGKPQPIARQEPMLGEAIVRFYISDFMVQAGESLCVSGAVPGLGHWQQTEVLELAGRWRG